MLEVISKYHLKLGLDSEAHYAAQKVRSKLQLEKRGGLEFVMGDGKIIQEELEDQNIESKKDNGSLWNIQTAEDDPEAENNDIRLVEEYMTANHSKTSNEELVDMLANEASITQDALSYSILFLFKRNEQEAQLEVIRDIVASIHQVVDKSDISISNFLIFILSFFNIVKLQIPITQIKPTSSLQQFTYDILVACIPLRLLTLSLDIVELVNDNSFYCMLDALSDIDDLLPPSEHDDMISLQGLFLICHHIKCTYLRVRYKRKSQIDIDIEEYYQDGDNDGRALEVYAKVKKQIEEVLYYN